MRRLIFILLCILFFAVIISLLIFLFKGNNSKDSAPNTTLSSQKDEEQLNQQADNEALLLNEYRKHSFSLKHPYVVKNPYGTSPLSALVMYTSKQPTEVSITINGKDKDTTIKKTFSGYTKKHQIPVLGLYPNKVNKVTIQESTKDGQMTSKSLFIKTDALPNDFLQTSVVSAKPSKMEDGLTFLTPNSKYAYAVDVNGDVRWYCTLSNERVFKRLKDGNILFITKKSGKYKELLEIDLLGKVYKAYTIDVKGYENSDVIHHDAIQLPNGNFLVTVHDGSKYIEDTLMEIDYKSGKRVRTMDMKEVFPKSFFEDYEGAGVTNSKVDWLHLNTLWYDTSDDGLLISSPHQDTIMKLSYPSGKVKWILADPKDWPKTDQNKLLTPIGKNFKYPIGQYSVSMMPDQDNNPKTLDILVFDNNNIITNGNKALSEKFSQAVQYRIDDENMTVKQIWDYGKKRGAHFFSTLGGNSQFLPTTGNRLITSGYIEGKNSTKGTILEVTGNKPAKVVFELNITGFKAGSHKQIYRALRMPLYPDKWDFNIESHQ